MPLAFRVYLFVSFDFSIKPQIFLHFTCIYFAEKLSLDPQIIQDFKRITDIHCLSHAAKP
jgi:hypothetical protein